MPELSSPSHSARCDLPWLDQQEEEEEIQRSSEKWWTQSFSRRSNAPFTPRARTRLCQLLQRSPRGLISPSRRTGHAPTPPLTRDLLHALHALATPATHSRAPASRAEHQLGGPITPHGSPQTHTHYPSARTRPCTQHTHTRTPYSTEAPAQQVQCAPIPALDVPGFVAVAYSPYTCRSAEDPRPAALYIAISLI